MTVVGFNLYLERAKQSCTIDEFHFKKSDLFAILLEKPLFRYAMIHIACVTC